MGSYFPHKYITINLYHVTTQRPCNIESTHFFSAIKFENCMGKIFDLFNIKAENIDCGYTLEPLRRSGSNEYILIIYVLDQNL